MTKLARLALIGLVLLPVLAACGKPASSSSAPGLPTLYASRLTLKDVTPITADAKNWWDGAPTFDVRPLNSSSRDDSDLGGLTIRFAHLGTIEVLSLNYEVWSSTTIASGLVSVNKLFSGNGLTGPKAGDQVLYYNKKLSAGPTIYNNVAYVLVGQTIITIIWSHVDGFATTKSVGAIATKAVTRLKDGISGKVHPSTPGIADPLLLAPAGPQLTLLGSARLPVEVLAEVVSPVSSPVGLADELRSYGITDFVFGDYALNLDTRMEVLTAGVVFSHIPPSGTDFIKGYLGSTLNSAGEGGGYDAAAGQYVYGFGSNSRAVLMVCKSSAEGEEAARACEAPMALTVSDWHQALSRAA